MKKCLTALALLSGVACANEVRYVGNSVMIIFDEPVVPLSVCQNGWNDAASDTDKGLDLFDVTGDDQHKPKARWQDQNVLQIQFVEGTSCETEYRLSFRPGCNKYLGQAEMAESVFTFRHPKMGLGGQVVPGLQEGAVIVMPHSFFTKEDQTFSPDSAVVFEYREIVEEERVDSRGVRRRERKTGATIPAVTAPAQLKHGLGYQSINRMSGEKPDWASLTPDSPLPGAVLVQPQSPLPQGGEWELVTKESAAFRTGTLNRWDPVNQDLGTGAFAQYGDNKELWVGVGFGASLTTEEAERAWRDMEVSVGGAKAVASDDGKTKVLTIDGRECRITLVKFAEPGPTHLPVQPYVVCDDDADGDTAPAPQTPQSYIPQGMVEGMVLKVEGATPMVMDIVVPVGVTSALEGRKTLSPHRHRLSLNPAWPVLGGATAPYMNKGRGQAAVAVLPLQGEHKLRLPLCNVDGVSAVAYRVPGSMLATEAEELAQAVSEDNAGAEIYELTLRLARHDHKVEDCILTERELARTRRDLATLRARKVNPKANGIASRLTATAEIQLDVPQGDDANLYTTEAVLDMDALLGGKAAPGVYMVRLTSHACPAARRTLAQLDLPENLLDHERFVLVQITDINVAVDEGSHSIIATRLSDGQPVAGAKVTPYILKETKTARVRRRGGDDCVMTQQGGPVEMPDGFASLGEGLAYGRGHCAFLVECGDDYTVCSYGYGDWTECVREGSYRTLLQTDRDLYRPGETVHVRGIVRFVSPEGEATQPKAGTPVIFRVRRPDGQDLVKNTITLDASGGVDESFVLPDGEEDVTGSYTVILTSVDNRFSAQTSVRAEIFRRDSFKVETTLTMDPVAPKEFTFTLQATDLNGTPVANGKATVDISSSVTLLTLQGEPQQHCDLPAGAKRNNSTALSREFKLDENGRVEIRGTFAPFLCQDAGAFSISGSVANDREEYVRFQPRRMGVQPADFQASFDNEQGRIMLSGLVKTPNGDYTQRPLDREQTVHVAIHYTERVTTKLPNGFVFVQTKPAVTGEADITVPANCSGGAAWDARGVWEEFCKGREEEEVVSPSVIISGTDTAGRCTESTFPLYSWRRGSDPAVHVAAHDSCKLAEDGRILYTTTVLRDGTACFVISCGDKVHHEMHPVKAGEQEIALSAIEGAEGTANITVYLPHPDAAGVFTRYETHSSFCEIPCVKYALQTQLDVPKDPVAPGSTLRLEGQVTKDGKGVPATVTLYAVDEGMLTVSRYSVPDLVARFTQIPSRYPGFSPTLQPVPADAANNRATHAGMMPGIWMGRWNGNAMAGGGAVRYNSRASNRSVKCAAPVNGMGMDDDCDFECCDAAPAAAPCMAVETSNIAGFPAPAPQACKGDVAESCEMMEDDSGATGEADSAPEPRLRTNFQPVAVWQGAVKTDADGRFAVDVALPDTLTTYKVYALVLGEDGSTFGNAEADFTVNQPLMLTPGTPLFMSTGDTLRLPLTVTNNTDADGTWTVSISSAEQPQKVTIKAHGTATVYFDFTAVQEGTATLEWTARNDASADAVQGSFPVRFPAPLLKEAHHIVLAPGCEQKLADLLAPELATSCRGEVEVHMSANPLLHLVGNMDYLLQYPYGCTEQTASGLLPWLFYDRLAPLSPLMAETPPELVHQVIADSITELFKRQRSDGGLGYWGDARESCPWASAYAALVLTVAIEQGYGSCVPEAKMEALRGYLRKHLAWLRADGDRWDAAGPMTLFALGRVLGDDAALDAGLERAAKLNADSRAARCFWHRDIGADLTLICALRKDPARKHDAFLQWMRARGHDYRHTTTLRSGWMLIALHEYLRLTPASTKEATVQLQDGTTLTLNQGVTVIKPQGKPLSEVPTVLKAVQGEVYVTFKAKAQPDRTEYPGVTEKGLQITRIYEKRGEDGIWREATDFVTGDVVRVTLTCAKTAPELEYFVLEDYLPSCMEAINPNVPSQAAGLEWSPWSYWFDHKEFLADRVRGFCTRWGGRDVLNMTYYARVKRSGTSTAPPAQGQLMYEPQTYGLSPNTKIKSK